MLDDNYDGLFVQIACQGDSLPHKYSRAKWLSKLMMTIEPDTEIGMEACASAHHWARKLQQRGYKVKLIAPQFVKPYVKSNKNDRVDAAAAQPESPTVCTKTPNQLAMQAIMRVRDRRISQRTGCMNQLRGLLSEHGIVIPKGIRYIRRIEMEQIPDVMQPLMRTLLDEFDALDELAGHSDQSVQKLVKAHPVGQRLLAIPGFGPINTLASLVINPCDYKNGRHYAAYLGLVPKQTGTGGQVRLQGLSKRGNNYHRKMMCHGARAFLCCSKNYADPLLIWAKRIQVKKGTNVAVGALANKLARISWRVMSGSAYCVTKAVSPMKD